jgi:hypothetical protein
MPAEPDRDTGKCKSQSLCHYVAQLQPAPQ